MAKSAKKSGKSAQLRISAQKRISALPRSVAIRDKDYLVLASFRRSLRNFLNFSEQAAQNRGLTPKQHQAILAIRGFDDEGGVTVGDLAEHLHLKHHTAVELVDRLVRAKLVVRKTDKEEVNAAIKRAAEQQLKGVLGFTTQPNVSIDFNHDPHSSVFHMDQTKVMDGTFVRVMSWYDNEWGFSNRMADTAVVMGKLD